MNGKPDTTDKNQADGQVKMVKTSSNGGTATPQQLPQKLDKLRDLPFGGGVDLQFIILFFGIFLLCVYSITIEKRDLTFAALVNNETEGKSENSSPPGMHTPTDRSRSKKFQCSRIASSKRNVANVNNLGNTNFNLNKGYLFFLMFWMASITAVFTNYFIQSRFHADKWSLNNKALLDILKEDNIPPFTDPKWKRFAHDLVITGMWGHRSFSKYFVIKSFMKIGCHKILDLISTEHFRSETV